MAAGKSQPVGALVRSDRDDLAEDLHAGAEIAPRERRVRVAAQRRHRLRHRAGVLLDLAFELDRRVGEIVALERLVGRGYGCSKDETDTSITSAAKTPTRK